MDKPLFPFRTAVKTFSCVNHFTPGPEAAQYTGRIGLRECVMQTDRIDANEGYVAATFLSRFNAEPALAELNFRR